MTKHSSNFCITAKKVVNQIPIGTRQVTQMRLSMKMHAQLTEWLQLRGRENRHPMEGDARGSGRL